MTLEIPETDFVDARHMSMRCSPIALLPLLCLLPMATAVATSSDAPNRAHVLDTMKRATGFMVDRVSYRGGYVWSYLPDLSRRWGELEARRTMIWIQPPGTPGMGNLFLDAYHATGDEYYYRAAEQAAGALIAAQHPSGGWNYVADLAGEESLQEWYGTIGRNAWRLEEFQHYYGNATFDDQTTAEAAKFILRLFAEKREPKYRAPLDRAIGFVLASQYSNGGWPQRYPLMGGFSKDGNPDYTSFITFNDDVAAENIDFLIKCYGLLGEKRLLDSIRRGMDLFPAAQQEAPQAGWALQYTPDMEPAGARTYEPKALATHVTAEVIDQLLRFYHFTGEVKFLARIPEALEWLDAVRLPPELSGDRGSYPTFVEVGTNRPLFIHRKGSNVFNGRYYADYNHRNTVGHYSSFRTIDVHALRDRLQKALATPPDEATRNSPLRPGAPAFTLPRVAAGLGGFPGRDGGENVEARVARVIGALNNEGYWPSPLRLTSNPYKGEGTKVEAPGDFSQSRVGDDTDTSPYMDPQPVNGISVATYIANMGELIRFLEESR